MCFDITQGTQFQIGSRILVVVTQGGGVNACSALLKSLFEMVDNVKLGLYYRTIPREMWKEKCDDQSK